MPPACPVDYYASPLPRAPTDQSECHRLARWIVTLHCCATSCGQRTKQILDGPHQQVVHRPRMLLHQYSLTTHSPATEAKKSVVDLVVHNGAVFWAFQTVIWDLAIQTLSYVVTRSHPTEDLTPRWGHVSRLRTWPCKSLIILSSCSRLWLANVASSAGGCRNKLSSIWIWLILPSESP